MNHHRRPYEPSPLERRSRTTAMDGAMALAAVLLIVQMWLLTTSLELFLAGHRETASAATGVSGVMFLACLGIYAFVIRLDRKVRR